MTDEVEEIEEPHLSAGNLMDSKTSHLDDALGDRLEEAFHKTTFNIHLYEVAKIASEYHPIDLAYAASRLPPYARASLFENLPDLEAKVSFLINTDGATRWAIFRELEDGEIKEVVQAMPADEVVWVLDDLPERRYRRVLDLLDFRKAAQIRDLEKHSRKSAGGLMTNEFFAFPMDTTIEEASNFIRENPGIDMTRRFFILDQSGKLAGYVPARNLIVNAHHLPLRQVMREVEHTVLPESTREEVVDLVERYKIPALPVVDEENFLIGVVSYEVVVEVIEDLADETIGRMAGTVEEMGEQDPVFKRFLARSPWLVVTLLGGLISASVMAYFQMLEAELLAFIVFFIPLINGMSGNVGIQCSMVLVRSMGIGVLSSGKRGEAVLKEGTIGLLTGVIFGLVCGLIVYLFAAYNIVDFSGNPWHLGVMVATGLLGASLTATILGVSSPFFFARVGVDPALASGPMVTALNDVMSMVIFFVISVFLNSFFFA